MRLSMRKAHGHHVPVSRGLAASVIAAVMAAGATGAAVATVPGGSGTPASDMVTASAPVPKCLPKPCEKADVNLTGIAKRYGVSLKQLIKALTDVEQASAESGKLPTDRTMVRRFAADLGVSTAKARAILAEVFGPDQQSGGLASPAAAADLARMLGVEVPQAQVALEALTRLGDRTGGIDPAGAEFAAVAKRLGVTPKQLAGALDQVKAAFGKGPEAGASPSPSGS
ncbi:hypothetical protein [Streptomyces sp. NBC_00079]|uniref:hypothetical protein n=1 Tax=Streptomyces sp. NBC_00079 TaxID=2975644 RepID=UPI00325411B1